MARLPGTGSPKRSSCSDSRQAETWLATADGRSIFGAIDQGVE